MSTNYIYSLKNKKCVSVLEDKASVKINSRVCKFNYLLILFLLGFRVLCASSYLVIPILKDLVLYLDDKPIKGELPFKSE